MKTSDRALNFEMRVMANKRNQTQNEGKAILHSVIVGDILRRYNFDDSIVTAGYLHNIVKDSNGEYTTQDMANLFHGNVASLLLTTSAVNLPLNTEDQRKHAIRVCRDLPYPNRVVIAAVLIANLELMKIDMRKQNNIMLDDTQKNYYESMLEILEEGFPHPIFERLYLNITDVFYNGLLVLNADGKTKKVTKIKNSKEKLTDLKELLESSKPFIIEFTSDSTEKCSLASTFNDFYQSEGFKIKVASEKTSRGFDRDYISDSSVDSIKRNLLVASELEAGVLSEISGGQNILIIEQGLFERLIWMKRLLDSEVLSKGLYGEYMNNCLSDMEAIVNYVIIDYSSPNTKLTKVDDRSNALQNCVAILNGQAIFEEDPTALGILSDLLPLIHDKQMQHLKLYLDKVKKVAA